jgi:hypothetical protein
MKIKTPPPSPLAMEYSAKKKLNARSKKSPDLRTDSMQPDKVALSSELHDSINSIPKPQPSKPVTLEEQQSLNSTFSIQA